MICTLFDGFWIFYTTKKQEVFGTKIGRNEEIGSVFMLAKLIGALCPLTKIPDTGLSQGVSEILETSPFYFIPF